uniref:Tetraspanin n=1 Tax=Mastacembelus armatus TaxID=205130 RepID=A0A3Q3LJN3_9TELE
MCVANFLCFLCGVAVLGFGVYIMVNFEMAALTPTLATFKVANALLISGIIITCVSFLGFVGALKENRCLLLTFFLLLFLLMLVELTAACLLLMYEAKVGSHQCDVGSGSAAGKRSSSWMTVDVAWQNTGRDLSPFSILFFLQLDCCGVENVTDWGEKVPESFCKNNCTTNRVYRNKGCLPVMKNIFEEHFLITGISVIVLCIIEVWGMCFAMTLYCHISRSGLGYKL